MLIIFFEFSSSILDIFLFILPFFIVENKVNLKINLQNT